MRYPYVTPRCAKLMKSSMHLYCHASERSCHIRYAVLGPHHWFVRANTIESLSLSLGLYPLQTDQIGNSFTNSEIVGLGIPWRKHSQDRATAGRVPTRCPPVNSDNWVSPHETHDSPVNSILTSCSVGISQRTWASWMWKVSSAMRRFSSLPMVRRVSSLTELAKAWSAAGQYK